MQRTLQYVLDQSAHGHHPLLDRSLIRSAFTDTRALNGGLEEAVATRASDLIDELRRQTDLTSQRAVIAQAPPDVQEVFVHLFFSYLDRYMHSRGVVYH